MDKYNRYDIAKNWNKIITVDGILQKDSLFSYFKGKTKDFLDYGGGNVSDGYRGIKNRQIIYDSYDKTYKKKNGINSVNDINGNSVVKYGLMFAMPLNSTSFELEVNLQNSNLMVPENTFTTMLSKRMSNLLTDPKYVPSIKYNSAYSNYVEISSHISVWVYMRSIDKIVDVSPYVESLSTSSSKEATSFSITLSPINDIKDTKNGYTDMSVYGGDGIQNSRYFFEKMSSNDVVFISFETLNIDKNRNQLGSFIPSSELKNRINDVIGLVDSTSDSGSAADNNFSVSIQGRDLSKMLIDDGAYFIPILFSQGAADRLFVNIPEDQRPAKRMLLDGTFTNLFVYGYRSIEESICYVLSYLTNMGVISKTSSLLSSYTKQESFKVPKPKKNGISNEYVEADGLWKIWELSIDKDVRNRVIQDGSLILPDGSIMDLIKKMCLDPFVEMFTDTYSDRFCFVVRKPPYSKDQIRNYLKSNFRIPSTERVTDSSSVKNTSEKTINDPTSSVEVDEVDDFFKRKTDNRQETTSRKEIPIVKIIEEVDIINTNLTFDDENAYSWYRYTPKRDFVFENTTMASYLPIIYFPEYAEVFGMRRKDVATNYVVWDPRDPEKKSVDNTYFSNQMVEDLAYIIETNAYLPFTKKGTITINGDRTIKKCTWIERPGTGEIYYVDGVRHDFSISNDTVERITTLTVSRGMVKKYVEGVSANTKPKRKYSVDKGEIYSEDAGKTYEISYFNIVNTELIKRMLGNFLQSKDEMSKDPNSTNSGINKEVFDFFMQKKQFDR